MFLLLEFQGGVCKGRNDAKEFADVRAAMRVLNFSDQEFVEVMKLLGAILHIGNLSYKPVVVGESFGYSVVNKKKLHPREWKNVWKFLFSVADDEKGKLYETKFNGKFYYIVWIIRTCFDDDKNFSTANMDACEVQDEAHAKFVTELLGVHPRALKDALTKRTIFAHGDRVVNIMINKYYKCK